MARRRQAQLERVGGFSCVREKREALDTIVKAFAPSQWQPLAAASIWRPPVSDPGLTRVAIADGRVVSVAVLGRRHLRFGPCLIPAMTIGPVATHPDYEGQGFGTAVMGDVAAFMARCRAHLGYIQGIPGFYSRFGYYSYLAKSKIVVQRAAMEPFLGRGVLRRMKPEDLPDVRRIYNHATSRRTCAARRDAATWTWLTRSRRNALFFEPRVIQDREGITAGYVTFDPVDPFHVREVVVRQDPVACAAALGAICRAAARKHAQEVELKLPWDGALMTFCRQRVGGVFHAYCNPTGGSLMRIVDFPRLMKSLEPLLSERIRAADRRFSGRMRLVAGTESVGLRLDKGTVSTGRANGGPALVVPERWLPGLLTGYCTPDDLRLTEGVAVPPTLRSLLSVLFPRCWPFVYQGDNY